MNAHFDVIILQEGKRTTKKIEAESLAAARNQIGQNGAVVLKITRARAPKAAKKAFNLILFIQELVALLEAGLVVVEAIEALYESSGDKEQRRVLSAVLKELYRGCQLSQAFAAQGACFSTLLISSVASSEHTGQLAITLQRFLHYEKRMATLRKKIRATMLYPLIVINAGLLIMFFLLGFIIPRFAVVFEGMTQATGSAKFIIWWGHLVNTQGGLLLIITAGVLAAVITALRSHNLRAAIFRQLWRIPQLNKRYQLAVFVRFYRTLGLLLQGGTPVIDALALTSSLLPADYRRRTGEMLLHIQSGKPLSWTLEQNRLTTPVASRLLSVGERSGELPQMCERIAAFYDEILERAIETFSKVFEPVLMLIVGGMVGLVVFLLYMPIFEIAGGLS
jgi:general secretion pathway protein F